MKIIENQLKITQINKFTPKEVQENNGKEELINIFPKMKSIESNHQNSKVFKKNSKTLEFNYPKKNFEEDSDKVRKLEMFNFSQIRSFYNINKDTEKVKNSLNIKA